MQRALILTGDIGGTKTLLALHDAGGAIVRRARYASAGASEFAALVEAFLAEALPAAAPRLACFGLAGPVLGERVKVTHLPWQVDAPALAARFGFERVLLLNDFAAAAHGLDLLGREDLVTLQAGEPLPRQPRVVIGAGTGLGLAFVVDGNVLAGEGGHAGFAPADAAQAALARWLQARVGRVQIEHVVSGRGLAGIYEFLLAQRGTDEVSGGRGPLAADEPAAAIARAALDAGEPLALAAVDLFLGCYGALAGDQALVALARGGVYLTGGIAPALLPRMASGGFLAAFNGKGEFGALTRAIPVHVVTNPDLPLLGAARFACRLAKNG